MTKIVTVIPSFEGCQRLRYTLESWKRHDPESWGRYPKFVWQDHSPNDPKRWNDEYFKLCQEFKIDLGGNLEWQGLQGAAHGALAWGVSNFNAEWILYMGDDLAFTPGSISNLFDFVEKNDLRRIGILQVPYWNSHEVMVDGELAFPGDQKYTKFFENHEWPLTIPRSTHYDNHGVPRTYARPNGCGFLVRSDIIKQCGGVSGISHRIDEKLGLQCWTQTDYGCITVPGNPWIHWFAGASSRLSQMPRHNAASEAAWFEDTGTTVAEADLQVRKRMRRWEEVHGNEAAMRALRCAHQRDDVNVGDLWRSDYADGAEKGLTIEQVREGHKQYWLSQGIDPKLMEGY